MSDTLGPEELARRDHLYRRMIEWLCERDRPPVQHMQAIEVLHAALDRLAELEDGAPSDRDYINRINVVVSEITTDTEWYERVQLVGVDAPRIAATLKQLLNEWNRRSCVATDPTSVTAPLVPSGDVSWLASGPALCRSCGKSFTPSHDASAPGPTTRHPFIPAT